MLQLHDRPELGLPNTNNALEGLFSELKTKVRARLLPLLSYFLSA